MNYFNFFLIVLLNISLNVAYPQVVIGEDPAEVTAEQDSAAAKQQSDGSSMGPAGERKITISKDDKEKILAVFKKVYPEKSIASLNHSLNKFLINGRVVLSPEESKELEEFLAKEADKGFLDKIQDYAMGGNSETMFAAVDDLRAAFKENPMSLVPKEKVKETLLKQWEGQTIGEMFKNNPRVLEFFAALMTDKVAINKLLDIFQKKNELKYFTVLVVLAQLMCILAFFALFKQSTILGRIFKRMLLMLGVNGVLLMYFVWRFYPEVSPTINIFRQSFFS